MGSAFPKPQGPKDILIHAYMGLTAIRPMSQNGSAFVSAMVTKWQYHKWGDMLLLNDLEANTIMVEADEVGVSIEPDCLMGSQDLSLEVILT